MKLPNMLIIIWSLLCLPLVQAQTNQLAILGSMANDSFEDSDELENDDQEEIENIDNEDYRKSFENPDYGFTGGRTFNSPPKTKFTDQPLEHYGYSYLVNQSISSLNGDNTPIPPDYLIGPDDNLKIILFGNNNKRYNLKVTREGNVFIPEIGPVYVSGITFEDVKDLIKKTINNQLIGTDVSITLGSLRSIDIFVLGAANKPGMYSISALSTLTNAIIKSGGINSSGSLRNIKLKRKGKTISSFDFYDLLINGDTSGDSRMMQGDVVFIEPIGKTAAIQGQMNRSGIFELKEGESLDDLIRFAGYTKPKANFKKADLMRINIETNSYQLLSLDLTEIKNEEFKINNGDMVSIYPLADNLSNAVLVTGHAQQPGFYPLAPEMTISDLFRGPQDLLENTDMDYALLKRMNGDSKSVEFYQIDFSELFSTNNSDTNIKLKNRDEIILLPSLLNPEIITTRIIKDEYKYDEETNQVLLEDERTSLAYLKRSLNSEVIKLEQQRTSAIYDQEDSLADERSIEAFYEYSIYNYCTIPRSIAVSIAKESGIDVEPSIKLSELNKLSTPEDFQRFQSKLKENENKNENLNDENLSQIITSHCRNELIRPLIELAMRSDDRDLSTITVFGNVHFPGTYPFTNGMGLADAIKASGGSKNSTYDSEIELTSFTDQGKIYTTKNILSSIENVEKVKLKKMDRVNLKQITRDIRTVEIRGEVFFPGTYPITENETIGDLIRRAGGIKASASVDGALFQRKDLKEAEEQRYTSAQKELRRKILLSSQAAGLGQESLDGDSITQLASMVTDNEIDTDFLGRLVIDLGSILNKTAVDITLEDGDVINIPKKKQSVSVIGEVYVPNSHVYRQELSIDDYIQLSGGISSFADRSNVYIIRADGSILSPNQLNNGFFRANNSSLRQGDTIVIPLQVQPFSSIKATTEVTQIIYQMALAAAAVNSF